MKVTRRGFLKAVGIVGAAAALPTSLIQSAIETNKARRIVIDGEYAILAESDFDLLEDAIFPTCRFQHNGLAKQGVDNIVMGKPIINAASLDAAIGRSGTIRLHAKTSQRLIDRARRIVS
jgi:hypothetical protein